MDFSLAGFGDLLTKAAGIYKDVRAVDQQDALQANQLRYQQQAAEQAAAQQATQSKWLLPALLIGGGLVLVMVLRK